MLLIPFNGFFYSFGKAVFGYEARISREVRDIRAEVHDLVGIVVDLAEAQGQAERFNAMYEEYVKNPTITKKRMFYETMESVLPSLKIIIQSDGGETQTILPLESFTGETATQESN